MRRVIQQRVILFIALLVLFIPAIQPLLRGQLTCGYDNVFHLYRAVQVDHLWDQGVFWSRWAPDMAHGYGFPLFLFTSPLAPMVSASLHRIGLDWGWALNLTFTLGMIIGGLGMAVLANELFGRGASVIASVAYVYAPFQAYDMFNRGSLWEAFAWAWVPWALWGLQRWMQERDRKGLLVGVLAFALMVLSHHLFAFLFAPLLVVWVIVGAIHARDWHALWRGVAFGVLGMGLSAFFWIPPLVERSFVQTGRLLGTWVFDFHYNFLSWQDVLALPRQADPLLINDWPEKALGVLPLLIGLLPLFAWRRLTRHQRGWVVVLWLLVLGYGFLVLSYALPVWETVPLLPFVQFPWRYLGPAATALALLAGAAWRILPAGKKRLYRTVVGGSNNVYVIQRAQTTDDDPRTQITGWLWVGVLASVLVFANLGWFFPHACGIPSDTSAYGIISWEKLSDTLGTTAKGEYLPNDTRSVPDDPPLLEPGVASTDYVRLDMDALPTDASIVSAKYGPTSGTIVMSSGTAFRATYQVLYYPGWRVFVNGQRAEVIPDPEHGFLTFDVPAGASKIEVRFVETPLRLIADGISVVAFVVLLWGVVKAENVSTTYVLPETDRVWAVLIVAVLVVLLKLTLIDGLPILWRGSHISRKIVLQGQPAPVDVNFDNQARLLDFDALPGSIEADASPVFTSYWQSIAPENKEWRIGVTAISLDEDQVNWQVNLRPDRAQREAPALANWPALSYARMDYHLDFPVGIPAGTYELQLALFDRATGEPASILGPDGNPLGPAYSLGQVELLPSMTPPSLQALDVPDYAELRPCGALGLWDFTINTMDYTPGDVVYLRWVMEALQTETIFPALEVYLVDSDGNMYWADINFIPVAARQGQRWQGHASVHLPGSMDSGSYEIFGQIKGCDETAIRHPITVAAPERVWTVPEDYTSANVVFGEVARLAGVTLSTDAPEPGQDLVVALAWETLAEMDTAYRVFIHVVRMDDGVIVAQKDNEPVNWTRPTTGWAKGEVVLDSFIVSLPGELSPGLYEVRVGLYSDAGRLATDGGDYTIVLDFDLE